MINAAIIVENFYLKLRVFYHTEIARKVFL